MSLYSPQNNPATEPFKCFLLCGGLKETVDKLRLPRGITSLEAIPACRGSIRDISTAIIASI